MPSSPVFQTREDLFNYLDSYAFDRKEEIDQHKFSKQSGLIKSYVLETSLNHNGRDIVSVLQNRGFQLKPIDNGSCFALNSETETLGFLEPYTSQRYWLLHSTSYTKDIDKLLQREISQISQLDRLWLSGQYFLSLWNDIVVPQSPDRIIRMKFETEARFEGFEGEDIYSRSEEDEGEESLLDIEDEIKERKVSVMTITDTARKVDQFLPNLQRAYSAFKSIKMLRLPASKRGGYEFWSWGKVTHRASSFREGRDYILTVTKIYSVLTEMIEKIMWLDFETVNLPDGSGYRITGSPLIINFNSPLSLATFKSVVDITFEQGKGPLRLWGNPLWLNDRKVHVYGVDLHLWQQIFLEFTPKHIIAILPKGTCGNTVNRLVTNVQSYIDPDINVTLAGKDYKDLIEDAFRKAGG